MVYNSEDSLVCDVPPSLLPTNTALVTTKRASSPTLTVWFPYSSTSMRWGWERCERGRVSAEHPPGSACPVWSAPGLSEGLLCRQHEKAREHRLTWVCVWCKHEYMPVRVHVCVYACEEQRSVWSRYISLHLSFWDRASQWTQTCRSGYEASEIILPHHWDDTGGQLPDLYWVLGSELRSSCSEHFVAQGRQFTLNTTCLQCLVW